MMIMNQRRTERTIDFISAVSTRFLSILYEKNVPHMIIYVNRNVLEGRIRESTMAGKNRNTRQTTNVIKLIRRINQKLNSMRSEEHTSELQSRGHLVCRLLLEKKK